MKYKHHSCSTKNQFIDMRQLTLLADVLPSIENFSLTNPVIEGGKPSITNPVIEDENPDLMRFLRRDKSEGGKGNVNQYQVPESRNYYYRYSYRMGNRAKHRHIPGGNIRAKLANERADIIRAMIARDCPTPEILKEIEAFGK